MSSSISSSKKDSPKFSSEKTNMKSLDLKTLEKIFVPIIMILVLLLVPGFLYRKFIAKDTLLVKKDRQFYENIGDIKTLLVGDSHTMQVMRDGLAENTFNFATGGENYIHSYYKLKKILSNEKNGIQTVILPINLNSFAYNDYIKQSHLYYWVKYVDYLELGLYEDNLVPNLMEYFQGQFFPYVGRTERILQVLQGKNVNASKLKEKKLRDRIDFSKLPNKEQIAKFRAEYLFSDGLIDSTIEHYFHKAMALCEDNDVKVILLTLPMSDEFIQQTKRLVNLDDFYKLVTEIKTKYPEAKYLNYGDLAKAKSHLFKDSDHLNILGSELINSKLIKEI